MRSKFFPLSDERSIFSCPKPSKKHFRELQQQALIFAAGNSGINGPQYWVLTTQKAAWQKQKAALFTGLAIIQLTSLSFWRSLAVCHFPLQTLKGKKKKKTTFWCSLSSHWHFRSIYRFSGSLHPSLLSNSPSSFSFLSSSSSSCLFSNGTLFQLAMATSLSATEEFVCQDASRCCVGHILSFPLQTTKRIVLGWSEEAHSPSSSPPLCGAVCV